MFLAASIPLKYASEVFELFGFGDFCSSVLYMTVQFGDHFCFVNVYSQVELGSSFVYDQ